MSATVYVWKDVERVTDNYHDGGGVMVVTARDPREVWREHASRVRHEYGYDTTRPADDALQGEPDYTLPTTRDVEFVTVFPDVGCC